MIRGFILSGGRKQYDFFVKWNNLNPSEFPMLKNIKQLSKKNNLVIKIGTWFMSSLYKDVLKFEEKINNKSHKGDDLSV